MNLFKTTSPLRFILFATALFAVVLTAQGSAQAKTPKGSKTFDIGFVDGPFSDDLLTNKNAKVRKEWFKKLKDTNAEFARINIYWSATAGANPPASPTDPNDPSYDWSVTDDAVRSAKKEGIDVMLTVLSAPSWAEGPGRPADVRPGAWRPDAQQLGDFAVAMATRFPSVRYYEAWNEPNLPNYISPQYVGKKPESSEIYRGMVNEFTAGIHSVSKKNKVVGGGTSPFGDKPGGKRQRPLAFWRNVLCLNKKLKKDKGCAAANAPVQLDIYGTNSISDNKRPDPTRKPSNKDFSVPANFGELGKIFKAGQKQGTVAGKKKMEGWSTETWYESKPGDPRAPSAKKQAQYQQESMYVLWKEGASAVFFLQLKDTPYDKNKPGLLGFQTGVYLANGKAKPSLTATQFPFVADRLSKKKVFLWGKAPSSGTLTVTDKGKKITKLRVKKGKIFTKSLNLKGKHKLQAKLGKDKSLPWSLK